MRPLVSVLMPVYNSERYLGDAIQSIIDQSYENFELLIFNDGSTDGSYRIINSFKDGRIRSFHFSENSGYVFHLNAGLKLARGKYIARMDSDDISLRDRFLKQVNFLEGHDEVGVCGTQIILINNENLILDKPYISEDDESLRLKLIANSCFSHPSVMIRRSIISDNRLNYDSDLVPAEDYAMWHNLSIKTKLANLPDVTLLYRKHSEQISERKEEIRKNAAAKIRKLVIEEFLGSSISGNDFELHNSLISGTFIVSHTYVIGSLKWLNYLIRENRAKRKYNEELFEEYLGRIWFSLCTHSYRLGCNIILIYYKSNIGSDKITFKEKMKFIIKAIARFSPYGSSHK